MVNKYDDVEEIEPIRPREEEKGRNEANTVWLKIKEKIQDGSGWSDFTSLIIGLFAVPLIIIIIGLILILIKKPETGSIVLGLGIIILGIAVWLSMKGFMAVPQMEEWIVELFKKYHATWLAGLHFMIPIDFIMRIKSKVTVNSTKLIKLFMIKSKTVVDGKETEIDDELEFEDDSAGVEVHIRVKALGSLGPVYGVTFTDEEIEAIEKREDEKNHDLLPEDWMYLAMAQVEAAFRGVCGGEKIDDAIKAVSYVKGTEKKEELQMNRRIPENARTIANSELAKYEIEVEEVLVRRIILHPDTEKKRRQIQLETKQILIEGKILEQKVVKAKQGRQDGLAVRNRLYATIEGKTNAEGKETESSGLTIADAMKYEIALRTSEKIGQINVLSGGEEKEPISSNIAARFGAAFGVGKQSVSEKTLPEKKKPDEEKNKKSKKKEIKAKEKTGKTEKSEKTETEEEYEEQ